MTCDFYSGGGNFKLKKCRETNDFYTTRGSFKRSLCVSMKGTSVGVCVNGAFLVG